MKGHKIIVIDYTDRKSYRSLTEASRSLSVEVAYLSFKRKNFGNRYNLRGHDLELIDPINFEKAKKNRKKSQKKTGHWMKFDREGHLECEGETVDKLAKVCGTTTNSIFSSISQAKRKGYLSCYSYEPYDEDE